MLRDGSKAFGDFELPDHYQSRQRADDESNRGVGSKASITDGARCNSCLGKPLGDYKVVKYSVATCRSSRSTYGTLDPSQPAGVSKVFWQALPITTQYPGTVEGREYVSNFLQHIEVGLFVVLPVGVQVTRAEVYATFAHRSEMLDAEAGAKLAVHPPLCDRVPGPDMRTTGDGRTRRLAVCCRELTR